MKESEVIAWRILNLMTEIEGELRIESCKSKDRNLWFKQPMIEPDLFVEGVRGPSHSNQLKRIRVSMAFGLQIEMIVALNRGGRWFGW